MKKFLKFNGIDQRPILIDLVTPKVDDILTRLFFNELNNYQVIIVHEIEEEFRYGRQTKEKFRQSD